MNSKTSRMKQVEYLIEVGLLSPTDFLAIEGMYLHPLDNWITEIHCSHDRTVEVFNIAYCKCGLYKWKWNAGNMVWDEIHEQQDIEGVKNDTY